MAIVAAVLLSIPAAAGLATGDGTDVEDTGAFGAAGEAILPATTVSDPGPSVGILAPTNGAPAFHLPGDELRVELDEAPAYGPDHVTLVPSFDEGQTFDMDVTVGDREASTLWEGPYERTVVPLNGTIPSHATAGLYDVVVPGIGQAHRALSVHESWPDEPRIVLLADTQTGDPRALRDGMEGSFGVDPLAPEDTDPVVPPDPTPLNESLARTFGVDVVNLDVNASDRWGAYRAAIERVNAIDPDLVLFSGDLNFGQLYPGSWHVEYEEAWALVNGGEGLDGTDYEGIHAPTLLSPGNHDGYVQSGEDGFVFWEAYFGPPAYSTAFGNVTFLSVNTYDWSEMDRMGAAYAVSSWGGQIRDEQLSWLRKELCLANGGNVTTNTSRIADVGCTNATDERVVTFSHHSPSWVQDDWPAEYGGFCQEAPCQGTPVFEQFTRGFISFTTTGQAWSGEGRLDLRETLREFDVDLHAAGHTHRDRVARDVGNGTIVETPQEPRKGLSNTSLHRVLPNGSASEIAFPDGRDLLRNGTGPLYLETTTTASETDLYFGFRNLTWHTSRADFPSDALGIPPFETGFPMTEGLLNATAREPAHWNASHAELGLFSTPTFLTEKG